MKRFARVASLASVAVALWSPAGWAQGPAGVVTTITGQANVARATLPQQPVPLRFKDDVFLRDRIDTLENSIVRLLLGGKALITVREQSSLTVTEETGRARVNLERGKVAVGVARSRMRPGEFIEVQSPNAVAAVRGTVLVMEVMRASAQATPAPVPATTNLYVLSGQVEVTLRPALARGAQLGVPAPVILGALQGIRVTGAVFGQIFNITPAMLGSVLTGLKPAVQHESAPETTRNDINTNQVAQGTNVATFVAQGGVLPTPVPIQPPVPVVEPQTQLPILPNNQNTSNEESEQAKISQTVVSSPPPPVTSALKNPGFESGLENWTSTGRASTQTVFGAFAALAGNRSALLHTATGAGVPGCAVGAACTRSTLSQTFTTPLKSGDGTFVFVSFKGMAFANEFPTFTGSNSNFNDKITVSLVDRAGVSHTIYQTTVNGLHSAFSPAASTWTADDFTLPTGGGVVNLGLLGSSDGVVSGTALLPDGEATIIFTVEDVTDTANPLGLFLDDVEVIFDPPLYQVGKGQTFTHPGTDPLVTRVDATETFDSLLVVGGTFSTAGPLLRAENSNLNMPFSLLSVLEGGRLLSTGTGPLVELLGGDYTIGDKLAMFEIKGQNTAVDALTGLELGTDKPVEHKGVFLDGADANITTRSVAKVDTALLEATAPLVNLRNGATMTVEQHVVDLSYQARVTALGPLVRLDGSTLTIKDAIVNVNGGVFSGSGTLLSLANNSTLSAGLIANVLNSGVFDWRGPLATFTGTGNTINLTNAACQANGCVTAGGLRFALQNGATAANIAVTNPTPFVGLGTAGTVNLPANAAHFVVNGANSKVSIAPAPPGP